MKESRLGQDTPIAKRRSAAKHVAFALPAVGVLCLAAVVGYFTLIWPERSGPFMREVESRAPQFAAAAVEYHKRTGSWPSSLDQLERQGIDLQFLENWQSVGQVYKRSDFRIETLHDQDGPTIRALVGDPHMQYPPCVELLIHSSGDVVTRVHLSGRIAASRESSIAPFPTEP